jgi:4-hydroxy-tetrahydrodipicolinate synthase
MKNLKGTGVAVVTPFLKTGKVDFPSLEKIIRKLIRGKVEYLVVLGTTGESSTLVFEEKKEVLACFKSVAGGKVPLVLGIGGNSTSQVIQQMGSFDLRGVTAILSVSPYYNKPNQRGLAAHYKAIDKEASIPVILYNVPGRTAMNLTAETTLKLAEECKNIIGIKEASGNMEQIMQIIKHRPKDFLVISGDDNLTFPILACGGDGVISVVANAYPLEFSTMVRKALSGNYVLARKYHYLLTDLTSLLFSDGNPGGIKAALAAQEFCEEHVRLPLVPVTPEVKKKILREIKTIG